MPKLGWTEVNGSRTGASCVLGQHTLHQLTSIVWCVSANGCGAKKFAHALVDYSKPGASFAHSSGIYIFSLSS